MDVTGWATSINALLMAGLVILTAWYAKSTKDMVEAAKQVPSILVDIDLDRSFLLYFVVRNVGNAVAKDIKIKCLSDVRDSRGHLLSNLSLFRTGIAYLAPGKEIRHLFDATSQYFSTAKSRDGWDFEITWSDLTGKKYPTIPIKIDPFIYQDIQFTDTKTFTDLVDKLEKIGQSLRDVISIYPKGIRIITTDDMKRSRKELETAFQEEQSKSDELLAGEALKERDDTANESY